MVSQGEADYGSADRWKRRTWYFSGYRSDFGSKEHVRALALEDWILSCYLEQLRKRQLLACKMNGRLLVTLLACQGWH